MNHRPYHRHYSQLTSRLPLIIILCAIVAMLIHGPIAQLANYHDFADQRTLFGMPHAADVLSNVGFFLVGLLGLLVLWPHRQHPNLAAGWQGYRLFLFALMLTSIGSAFYHLAPGNFRLVWDRLPIALACAGLLAAVYAETRPTPTQYLNADMRRQLGAALLAGAAVLSVAWWYVTEQQGSGDLRPYLLLQGAPLVLIPLWQSITHAPRRDRIAFGAAILFYIIAKAAELHDQQLLQMLGGVSGHSIKHVLATVASGVIVVSLAMRVKNSDQTA